MRGIEDRLEFYRDGDAFLVTSTLSGTTGRGDTKLWALVDFAVKELGHIPTLREVRQGLLRYAIDVTGTKKAAARAIGVSHRVVFYWLKNGVGPRSTARREAA